MSGIEPIVMPKWGLAMQEGMVAAWTIKEGDDIAKGQEICDIETSKIANAFESPLTGKVRRLVTHDGETVPVAYLIAVVADESVDDAAVDAYIADFKANFVVEDTGDSGPDFQNAETDAGRIRYLMAGDGDAAPIIFIHGFGGDLMGWMLNHDAVAQGRKAYAIDLPGHGGSTKSVGHGNIGSLTNAVAAFMASLGIAKAHLVGHSLGGGIALDMVRNHAELVESATLIAPAGLGPEINMDYIDGFMREKRGKKLKPYLEMLVNDPSMISKDLIEEVLKYKRLDGVETALNTIATVCFEGGRQTLEMTDRLANMSVPIHVIWGEADQILPVSHSEGLPGSIKVTKLPETGHLPQMEKSDEVNGVILSMLG